MFGLARWATGSPDTPGSSYWKAALRRAMDNLRWQADGIYQQEAKNAGVADLLALRDAYIRVMLGQATEADLLREHGLDPTSTQAERLRLLLRAQVYRQRMYTSCAYFFADLNDLSTRYGIASAAQVILLTRQATGVDLEEGFRADLRLASDLDEAGDPLTGADIYDDLLAQLDLRRATALPR
jgi:hypothetical protein